MIKKLGLLNIAIATALLFSACGSGGGTSTEISSAPENEGEVPTETTSASLLKGKTFYSVESCEVRTYYKNIFSETSIEEILYVYNSVRDSFSVPIVYNGNTVVLLGETCTIVSKDTSVIIECPSIDENLTLSSTLEESYARFGCPIPASKISEIVGLWDASYDMGIPTTQYLYISEEGIETIYLYQEYELSDGKINCYTDNQGGSYTENDRGNFDYTDGTSYHERVIRMLENGALEFTNLYQDQDPFTIIREKAPVTLEDVTSKMCYPN